MVKNIFLIKCFGKGSLYFALDPNAIINKTNVIIEIGIPIIITGKYVKAIELLPLPNIPPIKVLIDITACTKNIIDIIGLTKYTTGFYLF